MSRRVAYGTSARHLLILLGGRPERSEEEEAAESDSWPVSLAWAWGAASGRAGSSRTRPDRTGASRAVPDEPTKAR